MGDWCVYFGTNFSWIYRNKHKNFNCKNFNKHWQIRVESQPLKCKLLQRHKLQSGMEMERSWKKNKGEREKTFSGSWIFNPYYGWTRKIFSNQNFEMLPLHLYYSLVIGLYTCNLQYQHSWNVTCFIKQLNYHVPNG